LTGITLSHGRNLSNLGMWRLGSGQETSSDWSRLNTILWHSRLRDPVPAMEIKQETGSCRPKVRLAIRMGDQPLTKYREFQLFLIGYIIVSICEIFTVGGFPLDRKVRLVCFPFKAARRLHTDPYRASLRSI